MIRLKKVRKIEIDFFTRVINSLPEKYSRYLSPQVTKEFLLFVEPHPFEPDTYSLSLNANLEKRFAQPNLPHYFIIQGIRVWEKKKQMFTDLDLDILGGLLAGFRIEARLKDIDLEKIDISQIQEKHFQDTDQDKNKVEKILGKVPSALKEQLEIESAFEIETPNGVYYNVKHLGDGNYIAIDLGGRFFGMIHDPFEIELLFENKQELTKSLENGAFSFEDYYEKKMNT